MKLNYFSLNTTLLGLSRLNNNVVKRRNTTVIPPSPSRPEGLIGQYKPYLNSNDSPTRDILKDYSGQGHDIQLYNFGYTNGSGYSQDAEFSFDNESWDYRNVNYNLLSGKKIEIIDNITEDSSRAAFYITNVSKAALTYITVNNIPDGVQLYVGISSDKKELFNGKNLVQLGKTIGFFFSSTFTGQSIEIDIENPYPGALVSDGVDDYGLCENFPILTKEKGFTVLALRKYISDKKGTLVSNQIDGIQNCSFSFECRTPVAYVYGSFGSGNTLTDGFIDDLFSYSTSVKFNGNTLNKGSYESTNNEIYLFRYSKNINYYCANAALYALEIYDHDLTDEEIQSVKEAMYNEYLTATNALQNHIIADYECYDKTNEDEDRDILKDLSGNGHDITLYNFGFAEGSGYGKYGAPRLGAWSYVSSDVSKGYDSFTILKTNGVEASSIVFYNPNKPLHFKFKITGLTEGTLKLRSRAGDKVGQIGATYTKDGIYEFSDDSNSSWGFVSGTVRESCNITVEQLPLEYQGALVSDGVDDYGLCDNFPILNKEDGYTVLAIRKILSDVSLKKNIALMGKRISNDTEGAFQFERVTTAHVVYNFVSPTYNIGIENSLFSYQNSKNYNGISINVGDSVDTDFITLFCYNKSGLGNISSALYALKILDKDCTTEEIKFIAKQMVAKHKDKTGETIELNF